MPQNNGEIYARIRQRTCWNALQGILMTESLEGCTLGFLRVLRLVSINPIRYEVECTNCNSTGVYDHVYLRNVGVCKGSECRLIAERKAARQARGLNTPAPKDFSECPPLCPRSYDVWQKMRDERLRNTRR
jgi:hypothetical protein